MMDYACRTSADSYIIKTECKYAEETAKDSDVKIQGEEWYGRKFDSGKIYEGL